jgi:hypothetical protein
MKIFGTELPGTMDAIIKDAIEKQGFTAKKELMRFFQQTGLSGTPFFIFELSAAIPNGKDLTSAEDPVKYMMGSKLPYRIDKFLD